MRKSDRERRTLGFLSPLVRQLPRLLSLFLRRRITTQPLRRIKLPKMLLLPSPKRTLGLVCAMQCLLEASGWPCTLCRASRVRTLLRLPSLFLCQLTSTPLLRQLKLSKLFLFPSLKRTRSSLRDVVNDEPDRLPCALCVSSPLARRLLRLLSLFLTLSSRLIATQPQRWVKLPKLRQLNLLRRTLSRVCMMQSLMELRSFACAPLALSGNSCA